MQVHAVCRDALTAAQGGSICCLVTGGSGSFRFQWARADEQGADLALSAEKSEAHGVPPGVYCITVEDILSGETSCIEAEVRLVETQVVEDYAVTHATSDSARDGSIRAVLRNASSTSFLWTSGVITASPRLDDVRPGTYTMTPLSDDGRPSVFVHACAPAVVAAGRADGPFRA